MSEDIAFESHGNSEELVVVLHGLGGSRKAMEGVRKAIKAEKPNADIYCPNLEYGGPLGPFSRVPIEKIVDKLMTEMRQHWDKRQAPAASSGNSRRYTAITLVGHSLGGVLVRKIAILAYGETPGTPFEPAFAAFRQPSPLAPAIKRIIMLAGLSRGWTTSSAGNWLTTFLWGVLEIYGEMTAWITGTPYTVFAVRRGAPFLVQTRLQWLALVMRSMRPRGWNPAISPSGRTQLDNLCQGCCPDFEFIQLLGTQDDAVSPEDMLDNDVEMENSNYFIVEVPNSTHSQIIKMEQPPTEDRAIDQGKPEHQRYTQFKLALSTDRQALRSKAVEWEDVSDAMPEEPEWSVKEVVFVIHGIRDKGFWTQKIARRIKQLARTNMYGPTPVSDLEYRSVTASYGYFAMAPFVFPPVRTRKVAWLMDQYTEARVRYPNAKFSYVGHSNGTYLVARALKDYPAARFNRIVFAGSVVRSDYDWAAIAEPAEGELCQARRVEKVLNYVATRDWVVAAFPKAMQLYRWTDLGGASHDGFNTAFQLCQAHSIEAAVDALQNERVLQLEYVEGRHDAAIRETHWGDIASFVVHGTLPWLTKASTERNGNAQHDILGTPGAFKKGQPSWSKALGKLSVGLFPALVMLVFGLGAWLLWRIFQVPPCLPGVQATACVSQITNEVVARVGFFLAYLAIVFIVTTRF